MVRKGLALLCALAPFAALAPAAAAPAAPTGSFVSSDAELNTIWAASVKTALGTVVSGPLTEDALGRPCAIELPAVIVDGPVRDRCPYVGDEAVIGLTLNVSTPRWSVQRDMLEWFARHQHDDGAIPASPYEDGRHVLIDYNGYWLDALGNYVLYSGDVAFARKLWPNVRKLLDGYYPSHTENGLLADYEGVDDYAYVVRRGQIVAYYNAQYAFALRMASRLAAWVGEDAGARRWEARLAKLAGAFGPAFWDGGASAFRDTTSDATTHPQDAQAFAVLGGVATRGQSVAALGYVDAHMRRGYGNVFTDSDSWQTPTSGSHLHERVYPFISYFEVAARYAAGLDASALELLRREWGYMLRNGPRSTTWETIGPFGGGPTDATPSWAAGWSSGAAPALTTYVLGIQPTSPGYRTFTVTPHPGAGVSWARGSVITPRGLVTVSWRLVEGVPQVRVDAPRGTRWTNRPAN